MTEQEIKDLLEEVERYRHEAKLPRLCAEHIEMRYINKHLGECLVDSKHCEDCVEAKESYKKMFLESYYDTW